MWEQYRKTLRSMQVLIVIVAVSVLLWSHQIAIAALFFGTMQIGAALGGLWAGRLKRKLMEHQSPLNTEVS